MKKIKLTALLLSVCLLLCACMQPSGGNDDPVQDDPGISDNQNGGTPDSGSDSSGTTENTDNKQDEPTYPADLMIELVVEWEAADSILSALDDLSEQLRNALTEVGCQLDSVTITMSTAGAYTADSLVAGGIDAAILPAVDIIASEHRVSILALSNDEIPMTAIAVSKANDDLSEEFRTRLFSALTETETGRDFLSAICGEVVFSAPTEDALQAVRDYYNELMSEEGDHAE